MEVATSSKPSRPKRGSPVLLRPTVAVARDGVGHHEPVSVGVAERVGAVVGVAHDYDVVATRSRIERDAERHIVEEIGAGEGGLPQQKVVVVVIADVPVPVEDVAARLTREACGTHNDQRVVQVSPGDGVSLVWHHGIVAHVVVEERWDHKAGTVVIDPVEPPTAERTVSDQPDPATKPAV